MRLRLVPGLALLCVALAPSPARPAEDKAAAKPSVVLRFASLDGFLADFRYLAEVAERKDQAEMAEGWFKTIVGPKGLKGIDTKKPFGAYGKLGPKGIDGEGVVLVPIADQKEFIELIESLGVTVKKGDDGIYSVTGDMVKVPVFFRFANKYAYATAAKKSALDKDGLLDPATILPARDTALITLTVNVDAIPAKLRETAIGQADLRLANLKEKDVPGETEAQKKLRVALIDEIGAQVKSVLEDAQALTLRLNLDRPAGELSLALKLTAKQDSKLATNIADLSKVKSVAAGLIGADSALNLLVTAQLPQSLRKALAPVIDESMKKALDAEADKAKRDVMSTVLQAVAPTLKNAELDAGFTLRGPGADGLYTLVAGARVKDGASIEKALRRVARELPAEAKAAVKLDVDKVGAVAIHEITPEKVDAKTKKVFGSGPVYFAVREDAVLVAGGDKALSALKDALAAETAPAKVFQLELAMGRLAKLAAEEHRTAPEAAKAAFKTKGSDKVVVTLTGGASLQLRLSMKTQLIKFFSQIAQDEGK